MQRLFRCLNQEIANNGSWVSIMSIVTGRKVVNRGALVLFHAGARGFSLIQTMQIGYGFHRPTMQCEGKKGARVNRGQFEQMKYLAFS
jgi:hypothetical protein